MHLMIKIFFLYVSVSNKNGLVQFFEKINISGMPMSFFYNLPITASVRRPERLNPLDSSRLVNKIHSIFQLMKVMAPAQT